MALDVLTAAFIAVEDNKDVLKGEQGDTGPQGPKGPEGAVGPEGPVGAKGDDGQDGSDGAPGTDGKDGNAGQDGEGITWDGPWKAGSYPPQHAVELDGSSYITPVRTRTKPPKAPWQLMAKRGKDGDGAVIYRSGGGGGGSTGGGSGFPPGGTPGQVPVNTAPGVAGAWGDNGGTLAEVLTAGGDPDGNPVTGPLTITPTDGTGLALTLDGRLRIQPTAPDGIGAPFIDVLIPDDPTGEDPYLMRLHYVNIPLDVFANVFYIDKDGELRLYMNGANGAHFLLADVGPNAQGALFRAGRTLADDAGVGFFDKAVGSGVAPQQTIDAPNATPEQIANILIAYGLARQDP